MIFHSYVSLPEDKPAFRLVPVVYPKTSQQYLGMFHWGDLGDQWSEAGRTEWSRDGVDLRAHPFNPEEYRNGWESKMKRNYMEMAFCQFSTYFLSCSETWSNREQPWRFQSWTQCTEAALGGKCEVSWCVVISTHWFVQDGAPSQWCFLFYNYNSH